MTDENREYSDVSSPPNRVLMFLTAVINLKFEDAILFSRYCSKGDNGRTNPREKKRHLGVDVAGSLSF